MEKDRKHFWNSIESFFETDKNFFWIFYILYVFRKQKSIRRNSLAEH